LCCCNFLLEENRGLLFITHVIFSTVVVVAAMLVYWGLFPKFHCISVHRSPVAHLQFVQTTHVHKFYQISHFLFCFMVSWVPSI
jgi:uncharacterized membrane protein